VAEVVQQQVLPAPFIEAPAKAYLGELETAIGGLKGLDVSKLYGQQFVAGPGALQTQAETLAGGLGGYQPYLQGAAQAQQTAAGMVGPQAYQAYMSPYQQDVIGTTLQEYDIQAQKGLPGLAAQAISAGAFGGGREGVQRAEYQAASDRNRAALQAQLLQQGYGQAQQAAAQAFGQQQQLAAGQMNLAQQAPALLGQQIGALSALGTQQQAQEQAQITSTTTTCLSTSISTITNSTTIWCRCYGINFWISWKRNYANSSYTFWFTNWIRSLLQH
jgi:hypothetical protein